MVPFGGQWERQNFTAGVKLCEGRLESILHKLMTDGSLELVPTGFKISFGLRIKVIPFFISENLAPFEAFELPWSSTGPVRCHSTDNSSCCTGTEVCVWILVGVLTPLNKGATLIPTAHRNISLVIFDMVMEQKENEVYEDERKL